jgi:beta-xylosidase
MSLSSADLRKWESRGWSFSSTDTTVANPFPGRILWDSDGHYYDGKYYLYGFYEWRKGNENFTFVLESDSPMGKFTNFRWVTGDKSGKPIDAISTEVFTDFDGQQYATYSPTMNAVEDNTAHIARLKAPDVIEEESVTDVGKYLRDFYEAPSLRRRGDIYYLVYAENCGKIVDGKNNTPKRLSYATAKNIFGPYTYRGIIITVEDLQGNGNIQGSIEQFGDSWYVFYHRSFNGRWNKRALCIEKITFDKDGLIVPVVPTGSGIAENGLSTSNPVWFNTAVFGKNYTYKDDGKYGTVHVSSNAEIGFRYINFTGKEKSLTFSGEDLENITYIKVFAGGKLLGERRGNGAVAIKKSPRGKSELMISITTLGDVKLETLMFQQ